MTYEYIFEVINKETCKKKVSKVKSKDFEGALKQIKNRFPEEKFIISDNHFELKLR